MNIAFVYRALEESWMPDFGSEPIGTLEDLKRFEQEKQLAERLPEPVGGLRG